MKNYREMAEDVLRRAEEEKQKQKTRRTAALAIAAPLLLAAAVLAVVLWPKNSTAHGQKAAPPDSALRQSDTGEASPTQPLQEVDPPREVDAEMMWPRFFSVDELAVRLQEIADGGFMTQTERAAKLDELTSFYAPAEAALPGYFLRLIEVTPYDVFYYYLPESERENPRFSENGQITVCCSREKEMTLSSLSAQFGISVDQNGVLYDPETRYLHFEAGDAVMSIFVPEELNQYDRLLSMRAVEHVTVSPDNRGAALMIPAVTLPDPGQNVEADMIGLVVYQGAIYTQAREYYFYYGAEDAAVQDLIGEYLGRASGTIDEWSTQDAYAEELASTLVGDVHAVVGYSPAFRICVTNYVQNADGSKELRVQFLEHLNGIGVTTAADIYSKRLHMENRITDICYQTYADWNNGRGIYYPLESVEGLDAFLEALNKGQLQYVYEDDPGFYRNTRPQAFLYLELDDGTTVPLRLIEGGWVGYAPMPWYFVQLPDEVFDPIFWQCLRAE